MANASWYRNRVTPEGVFNTCLYGIALGMPLSKALVSVGSIFLSVAFLWMFFKGRIPPITKTHRIALVLFLLCFLVHVLSLLRPGADMASALRDVKIKLPLLYFPVVFAYSVIPKRVQTRFISLFIAACTISATITVGMAAAHYLGWKQNDFRAFSPFISHIRLSLHLLIAMLLVSSHKLALPESWAKPAKILVLTLTVAALVVLQSLTGLGILVILVLLFFRFFWKSLWGKALWLGTVAFIGYAIFFVANYFIMRDPVLADQRNYVTESGHFVYRDMDNAAMRKAWNAQSAIPFDSTNSKGYVLHGALVRYLSSKDLPRNATGIQQLTEEDRKRIIDGQTHFEAHTWWPLRSRLEALRFQLEILASNDSPNSNSVGMRWVYWNLATQIWQDHFWWGVSMQNLRPSYKAAYEVYPMKIDPEFQKRAHNQWLTFLAAFGVLGGLVCIVAWIVPVLLRAPQVGQLGWMAVVSIWASFFFEDTVETQMGATFAAFWFAWFVLRRKPD